MENQMIEIDSEFIWETHGIHVGTGDDHVKHGVDEIEEITEKAIASGAPAITFIIHTPRLTRFRYDTETETDIKFIRGNSAYLDYPDKIKSLKEKYSSQIEIRYGIELEWLGSDLGLQWNRSKIFQAADADFVIGSVHFSKEGIPYDGSKEESEKLLKLRGGAENYWAGYLEEVMEMIDCSSDMIQVVGHLDVPKLNVPIPEPILNINKSSHHLARRMRTLLDMVYENNLALDMNLAGIKKGCGIYPVQEILSRANKLGIPISIGTDTHHIGHYSDNYKVGIEYALKAGYTQYVSFSNLIPEKRPLQNQNSNKKNYQTLNLAIEMLNRRFSVSKWRRIPRFSFGGEFRNFLNNFPAAEALGDHSAISVRREFKSITIGEKPPKSNYSTKGIVSRHQDKTGVLSVLFNTLASESINVETAFLNSHKDGTASAIITLDGSDNQIEEAVEFIEGTATDKFIDIKFEKDISIPEPKTAGNYLLEVDGVELPIPLSRQMIITIHNDKAGVLLILLSALGSKKINIRDMQLGQRGTKGYAVLGVDGDEQEIHKLVKKLGPDYFEASHIVLNGFNE
jgi:HisJ family histidinol phosphate phosphatase